jgi:hypothetical protein
MPDKIREEYGKTHDIYYLLLSHGNNGYANAPRSYALSILPVEPNVLSNILQRFGLESNQSLAINLVAFIKT